ncbi:MAG TPA: hypothetical protein PK264_14870 [Hyphomicrobiaceae bacterium]|nr:hypothetical protein [Hyphomicrobiaceae bacterium]
MAEALRELAANLAGAEKRRVRFTSIQGLERGDLPLACEVWCDDLYRSPWAERDTMKLATLFVRYICNPNPTAVLMQQIERQCQLARPELVRVLALMKSYGAVDSFMIERDDLRLYLNLTRLQRLRVLEVKHRLAELQSSSGVV